jgi:hypothetical protein
MAGQIQHIWAWKGRIITWPISRVGQSHIYTGCIYVILVRKFTEYTVMYGVYIRFWPDLLAIRHVCLFRWVPSLRSVMSVRGIIHPRSIWKACLFESSVSPMSYLITREAAVITQESKSSHNWSQERHHTIDHKRGGSHHTKANRNLVQDSGRDKHGGHQGR